MMFKFVYCYCISTGSVDSPVLDKICCFSFMSRDLTAFSKKLFRVSATSLSSDIMSSLSTRLICANLVPFSDKRGLTSFPELLVISYFINIQIIIVFLSFLFIQSTAVISLFRINLTTLRCLMLKKFTL